MGSIDERKCTLGVFLSKRLNSELKKTVIFFSIDMQNTLQATHHINDAKCDSKRQLYFMLFSQWMKSIVLWSNLSYGCWLFFYCYRQTFFFSRVYHIHQRRSQWRQKCVGDTVSIHKTEHHLQAICCFTNMQISSTQNN